MSKYRIKLKQKRCISCKACEVHCKAKNRAPQGIKLGRLFSEGPEAKDGLPRITNRWQPCYHCEKPECVPVCPTGAMTRREEDGVVYVEADLCIGCQACVEACPWHIPQWDEASGKVLKCDLCRDRIDAGLKPACVTGCTAHALEFVVRGEAKPEKSAA